MTAFSLTTTRIKSDSTEAQYSLDLDASHRLVAATHHDDDDNYGDGEAEVTSSPVQSRFPNDIDVFLGSSLRVSFSGALDQQMVTAEEMKRSAVCRQLIKYLQLNAEQLGLEVVSECRLSEGYNDDESCDDPYIMLIPKEPLPPDSNTTHVKLLSIHLKYAWKSKELHKDGSRTPATDDSHPFASKLLLPISLMLADVHQKFISRHLVKRYPLIFGLWGRALKQESAFFSPIARSISNIISRSPNQTFRSQANTLINKLAEQHASSVTASTSALSQYLGDKSLITVVSSSPHLGTEESIYSALTMLYKSGTTRPHFRPTELAAQEKDDVIFTEAAHDTSTTQATTSPDQAFLDLPIADEDAPHVPLLSLAGPGPTKEQYDALLWMLGLPDPNDSQAHVDVLESPPSPFQAPSSPAKNSCSSANPPDNDRTSLAHLPVQSATDGSVLLDADDSHQDVSFDAAATSCDVPDDDDENLFCIDVEDDADEDEDEDALDYCEMDICLAAFDMDMDVDIRPKKQEPEMTFLMDSDSDGLEDFDEDEDMASVSISPRSSSYPCHEGLALLQCLASAAGGSAISKIKHYEDEEIYEDDMFLV